MEYKIGDVIALPPEPLIGTRVATAGDDSDRYPAAERTPRGWILIDPDGEKVGGPMDWRGFFYDWNEGQPVAIVKLP